VETQLYQGKDNHLCGYVGSKRKLTKLEEDMIAGYVMAQCYPEYFEFWLNNIFENENILKDKANNKNGC